MMAMRSVFRIMALLFFAALLLNTEPAAACANSNGPQHGAEIRVAVASNFTAPIREIAARFEKSSGCRVTLAFGSTGKHYAQIVNGAPFDVFFAADAERPRRLEVEGVAVAGSRFTYAVGRLALWSPAEGFVDPEGKVLAAGGYDHLAIANPRLAPYGAAAQEVLEALGLWEELQGRLVRGENISQAHQFVSSGSAALGFVALSQVRPPGEPAAGSCWLIPPSLYRPIEQQAVLLNDMPAARAFLDFVRGGEAREIIRSYGYDIPE